MLNQRRGNKEAPEPFFYDTRKSRLVSFLSFELVSPHPY